MFGIFGHGNVDGIGQALLQYQRAEPTLMPYHQGRNEQAQVHQAVGYARHTHRRATYAVTTSIGPGATNMLAGAALATTNRLPVLLLPADVFANRAPDPVLQQLERPEALDVSVNDAFRPLSVFFDRVWRPEQLPSSLMAAMRVLTDPAATGAVVLSIPQDVQTEALTVPGGFLDERQWRIRRPPAEPGDIAVAAQCIRAARRPLIIAGGGVLYAQAEEKLKTFAVSTGIPVATTQAGVGVLPWDHPQCLGGVGSTGTSAANAIARAADLITSRARSSSSIVAASGYTWVELGPYDYLPTDPARLTRELQQRGLRVCWHRFHVPAPWPRPVGERVAAGAACRRADGCPRWRTRGGYPGLVAGRCHGRGARAPGSRR